MVIEALKKWRLTCLYRAEDDFLFPSIAKNGSQSIQPNMILRRHIRPPLERLGVIKRMGWHSFRHGLATMLLQKGVDVKTAQSFSATPILGFHSVKRVVIVLFLPFVLLCLIFRFGYICEIISQGEDWDE